MLESRSPNIWQVRREIVLTAAGLTCAHYGTTNRASDAPIGAPLFLDTNFQLSSHHLRPPGFHHHLFSTVPDHLTIQHLHYFLLCNKGPPRYNSCVHKALVES